MRCPICKKLVVDPSSGESPGPFPFCSDRCKLIDLGRWLSDAYQIPVRDPDEHVGETPSYVDPDQEARPRE